MCIVINILFLFTEELFTLNFNSQNLGFLDTSEKEKNTHYDRLCGSRYDSAYAR